MCSVANVTSTFITYFNNNTNTTYFKGYFKRGRSGTAQVNSGLMSFGVEFKESRRKKGSTRFVQRRMRSSSWRKQSSSGRWTGSGKCNRRKEEKERRCTTRKKKQKGCKEYTSGITSESIRST